MDSEQFTYLRRYSFAAYKINPNAISRIISRGLGQIPRPAISYTPFLDLVNSESHILCSDVDITTNKVAFGRWALPKLRKELLNSDPLVSKRALMALLDMVHDPEKAVEVIRLQFIPRLVRLMLSKDTFTRQRALMVLEVLAMQPDGKLAICKNKFIIKNLQLLMFDPDTSVRLSTVKALLSLATWFLGVEDLIKQYFIIIIINRLEMEYEIEIMIVLLDILSLMLNHNSAAQKFALDNNAIELAVFLEHPSAEIRASAGGVLEQLAQHPEGKLAMLNHRTDILQRVTQLLTDQDVAVRSQATAILMFILIETVARKRVLQLPTVDHLLQNAVTSHYYFPLQVNSIKALTLIAECRDGQGYLKKKLQILEDINSANCVTQKHKVILLSVVTKVV